MEPKSQDWHRADIKSALEKRGITLRDLSRQAGLSPDFTAQCLYPLMAESRTNYCGRAWRHAAGDLAVALWRYADKK
ncbi:transcriptional regulator [Salmonella enterica subsp. diarizonae]|uniref:Transcriptional regulator n=1 Tax=Salmonella diarizonae TaxID=59204 RepID=A0A379TYW2_SALDZ|nr:transcriptional regulator [Salmonella enterica subsp. diarizonae]